MIVIPKGSHSEELSGDMSFLEAMRPGALDPPDERREEAGRRLEAAVKLVALRLEEYRRAVIATNGPDNAEQRVTLNARACFRRVGLAALLLGET